MHSEVADGRCAHRAHAEKEKTRRLNRGRTAMRPDTRALLAVMALLASAVSGALSGCGGADDSGSTFDASARDATDAASLRDDAGVVGFDDGSPSFGQDAPSV